MVKNSNWLIKNKKAGSKFLLPVWVIILVMFILAVLFSISIFYNKSIDVRKIEAGILKDKVIDCLDDNGKLNSEIDFSDEDSFIEECEFAIIEENDQDYFIGINLETGEKLSLGVEYEYAELTEFSEKETIFLKKDNKFVKTDILVGINKKNENLGKKNV